MLTLSSCNKIPDKVKQESPTGLKAWHHFTTGNSSLPDNHVNALTIDKKNIVWVGTAKGLARYTAQQWTTYTGNTLPDERIQALATEDNGTLWVGTSKGLARYDGQNWKVFNKDNNLWL